MIHRAEISESQAHALAASNDQRRGGGINLAVHGENIKFNHLQRIGSARAWVDSPFAKHDGKVAIDAHGRRRMARVNHQHSHHPHPLLGHFIVMRVVHEGAEIPEDELVVETFVLAGSLPVSGH